MGMFEFSPVGIPIAIAGIIYMLTVGVRLMPNHEKEGPSQVDVGTRTYQADLVIPDGSSLIGKTIGRVARWRPIPTIRSSSCCVAAKPLM